jgi:hypothetical protein
MWSANEKGKNAKKNLLLNGKVEEPNNGGYISGVLWKFSPRLSSNLRNVMGMV